MNIGKTLPIIVGVMAILLLGLYFTQGGAAAVDGGDSPPCCPTPALKELKDLIDECEKSVKWDISSQKRVKEKLAEINKILIQIDSDFEGNLINEEDKSIITEYYQNMLGVVLDRGIHTFFQTASYNQRGSLYPIYQTYKQLSQRNNRESSFPVALQYYIVSQILTRDVDSKIDSLDLAAAKHLVDKIEEARSYPDLASSDVFETLADKCMNLIANKVLIPYRNNAKRFFSGAYEANNFNAFNSTLNDLQGSSLSGNQQVRSFIQDTEQKLTVFKDCPTLLANQDTTTLCQFCLPYDFYKAICNN